MTIEANVIRWQCPKCDTWHEMGKLPPQPYTVVTLPKLGVNAGAVKGLGAKCDGCGWDADL